MTVVNVQGDVDAKTLTVTAEFDAPIKRVWQLWEDPRQLERWWGPPTYPATVTAHDLTPGGGVSYFMTGPHGDTPHGYWRILEVDAPLGLAFESGLADDSGNPTPNTPSMINRVVLSEQSEGVTRMAIESTFPSLEAMEMFLEMGMQEGITGAVSQIDALL
jgi:uncharacterized protein YndB with AHSA1/START domain